MKRGRSVLGLTLAASLVLAVPVAGESAEKRDRKQPRIKQARMVDADGDFFADKLVLTYNEKVRYKRDSDGKYPFRVQGYAIASIKKARGKKIVINLEQAELPDGLAIPTVKYRNVKKGVRDRAGNRARKQTFRRTQPFADAVVVTVNREGDGTVASLPLPFINCGEECMAAFPKGLAITLNASDPEVAWSGDCGGAAGPICQLTLDSDKTVGATFGAGDGGGSFTLTVTKAGTGDAQVISVPPGIDCGTTCSAEFPANTPVALNANTLIGTVTWSGCLDPTALTCQVIMDSDKTVTATFSGSPVP